MLAGLFGCHPLQISLDARCFTAARVQGGPRMPVKLGVHLGGVRAQHTDVRICTPLRAPGGPACRKDLFGFHPLQISLGACHPCASQFGMPVHLVSPSCGVGHAFAYVCARPPPRAPSGPACVAPKPLRSPKANCRIPLHPSCGAVVLMAWLTMPCLLCHSQCPGRS